MTAKSKAISQALNLSRQIEQTIIFITQDAGHIDKNIISSANVLVFKELGMLQLEFDRLDDMVWDCVYSLMKQPALVDEYLSSDNDSKRVNELKKRIGSLKQKIEQTEAKIRRIHEGYESNPPIYTVKEVEERIKTFRILISRTEEEKRRLENIMEQHVVGQNTIEIVRRSLEDIRNENLDNASFNDKQELIAKLGIMVYPSEDHKTVRITSRLPVLGDNLSRYKISIASPKL